ncbi:cytochrome P450 [Panus rudis PR-1116 ss-1]|nr:cytochrome P450 [Panus rudis PR-1116 ss-1]
MGIYVWGFAAALLVLLAWKVIPFLLAPYLSPLRSLPGPPSPSWLYGQMKGIMASENSVLHEEWIEKYGRNITYTTFFSMNRLLTVDTRALNHILTHSFDFQKPTETRELLTRLLGLGVLVAEGEQHRQQRRVLNPAFGPAQIRELTPIFNQKATQLRDIWKNQVSDGPKRIDALHWLSRTTLDIIGLAGFNHEFNTLSGEPDELSEAFRVILQPDNGIQILNVIVDMIPGLRYIFPSQRLRDFDKAREVMRRVGLDLIARKKASILARKQGVTKNDLTERDLLTLLIKANMATDVPENQKLSDEDVLAQIPTFLAAGHETTSSSVIWCLYALTQAPDVQQKLREELLSVPTDNPTMDELVSLPYLDKVVRETLRVHAPVPNSVRQAMVDAVIPVSEPYTDRNGEVRDEIRIAKGDLISISLLVMNRLKMFWGEDAHEFRPERWEKPPAEITEIPGVWGHMMTFLGGPRACIGFRFSLIEMKAIIFTLLRSFEFELAVPPEHVAKKSGATQRPLITTEPEKGNQLPLIVKLYKPEEA